MSHTGRLLETVLFTNASMAGNLSASAQIEWVSLYSVQCIYTGAGVNGTLKLQASTDGTTFVDIVDASQAIVGAGSTVFNVADSAYKYVQLVFTNNSGTGTLSAKIYGKGF